MALLGFLTFTAGVLALTYYITRKDDHESSDGFFLGGRSLTGIYIAGSLMLTNLSTEQLTGLTGQSFSQGLHVMAWEVCAAIAMIILALFFLPRYLKRGITTTPQYLEDRYDKQTRTMVSCLFLFGYAFILLPVVLYSGALTINSIFEFDQFFGGNKTAALWFTVWGIGILGSFYAIWGGLKAVAVSDTINGAGLIFGGLLIPYLGLKMIGDGSWFQGFSDLIKENPEKFISNADSQSFVPWTTLLTGMLFINMYYWCTNQAITQRALSAKDLKEGQKGVLLAAFLKILGPLIVVLPGIIAFHLFSDEIISTGNADETYPILVRNVLSGYSFIKGLFAAVLVGAILSSFNSALNSASTLFSLDLYGQYINKKCSEEQAVKAGRIFGTFLALFAMGIAPLLANAGSIFGYLQKMNGIYNVPVITIFLVGFIFKKVSAKAAKAAILFGMIFYSISAFAGDIQTIFEPGTLYDFFGEVSKIHFLHFFGLACLLSAVLMLFFPKMEKSYEDEHSEDVDITPWSKASFASFVILLATLSLYGLTWNSSSPASPDAYLNGRLNANKNLNRIQIEVKDEINEDQKKRLFAEIYAFNKINELYKKLQTSELSADEMEAVKKDIAKMQEFTEGKFKPEVQLYQKMAEEGQGLIKND